jgi:mono/diheme cytochrome c family protein
MAESETARESIMNKIVLFLLAGAGLALAQGWEVPEAEKAKKNPIEATPAAIEEGKVLFQKQCLMCHGKELKGDGPAVAMFQVKPPDLSTAEARARLTDGEIFYKMSEGKSPMPAMKAKLSEEERWKVVLYVRSLQAK